MNEIEKAIKGVIESKKAYDAAESIFMKFLRSNENIIAAWVYGSFARGDFTSRSDIDFFILTRNPKSLSEQTINVEKEILRKTGKNAHIELQGIKIRERDKSLIKTILKEGRLLYSRGYWVWEGSSLGLKPYYIYKYDITSIPASARNKLTRSLYTSKSWYYKDGKKVLKEYSGMKSLIRLGKGCVMIPAENEKELINTFQKLEIKHHLIKMVWL